MKFSLLSIVLMAVLPAAALAQQSAALADLVGTWVGGPTDSTWTALKGKEMVDTLILQSDSTFRLSMTIGGRRVRVDEGSNTYVARLANNNISWRGGAGYNFELDGKRLTMVSVRKNPTTGKHHYMAFLRSDVPSSKP